MHITIICDVLGEANNGTTIAALNLINSMRIKGHSVNVVCSDEYQQGEEGYYIVNKYNLRPFNIDLSKKWNLSFQA